MEQQPLTNLAGLAIALNLPRDWLRSAADAGQIPCLRIGRKLRFNVNAVRHALATLAGERPSPVQAPREADGVELVNVREAVEPPGRTRTKRGKNA